MLVIGGALAATVAFAAVLARDDDAPAADPASLSAECEGLHSGHNTMAWDPTQADEMVDRSCGWPYDPFLSTADGGEEDPALAAPFEARRYAELSDVLAAAGAGLCSVGALPAPPAEGFAFGFRYGAAEPGCPGATPTVDLEAREWVTRAQRDAAAHAAASDRTFVLGRWTVTVTGDTALAEGVVDGLVDLGAVAVPS